MKSSNTRKSYATSTQYPKELFNRRKAASVCGKSREKAGQPHVITGKSCWKSILVSAVADGADRTFREK